MGKIKKLSARKDVQDMIKELDPASCRLPCQTAHVPSEVLKLTVEYKEEMFPEKVPTVLPPSRTADQMIYCKEKFRIINPWLYWLASSEDKKLLKQLDYL